jgi:hypothetical protein
VEKAFEKAFRAAAATGLPGIEHSTSYGTPALKVAGKLLLRVRDEETLVLMCSLEEKDILMEAAPEIYFETEHYKGWPAVLARTDRISEAELGNRIAVAWRMIAPKKIQKLARTAPIAARRPST